MQALLNRLSDNFDVGIYQIYDNKLNQKVARIIACDKAYSILQPDSSEEKYEILYLKEVQDTGITIPFAPTKTETVRKFNLSIEEVIAEIADASTDMIQKLISNPVLAKHGISL